MNHSISFHGLWNYSVPQCALCISLKRSGGRVCSVHTLTSTCHWKIRQWIAGSNHIIMRWMATIYFQSISMQSQFDSVEGCVCAPCKWICPYVPSIQTEEGYFMALRSKKESIGYRQYQKWLQACLANPIIVLYAQMYADCSWPPNSTCCSPSQWVAMDNRRLVLSNYIFPLAYMLCHGCYLSDWLTRSNWGADHKVSC